jgi:hypothetical protein
MRTKEEVLKELRALEPDKTALEKELSEICDKENKETEARIQKCLRLKDKFAPDELVFAAFTRCECGAGMAYPKNIGAWGSWHCSAILLGEADPKVMHSGELPFNLYEVKSENQPSANGATTRK